LVREIVISDPLFNAVIEKINQGENELKVSGLHGSAKSLLFAALFKTIKKPQIIICSTERKAKDVYQDVSFFLDGKDVVFYPPWEIVSTDMLSYQGDVESRRIDALFRLIYGNPAVFVVPLSALLQRAIPRNILEDYVETISIGDTLERDSFTAKLDEGGYRRVALVEEEGEFSVRGHVIDIFPPISDMPLRMLFIGDELESIREFDTVSQRSAKEIDEFILTPARELILSGNLQRQAIRNLKKRAGELGTSITVRNRIAEIIKNDLSSSINPLFLPLFYNGLDTIFDYVPEDSILIFDDFIAMEQSEEKIVNDVDGFLLKAEREEKFYLEKEFFCVSMAELFQHFVDFKKVYIEGLEFGIDDKNDSGVKFHIETNTGLKKKTSEISMEDSILAPFVEKIRKWMDDGNLVYFLCSGNEGIQRMSHLLMGYSLPVTRSDSPVLSELTRHNSKGSLVLRDGKITEGFHFPGLKLVVVGEEEVFGKKEKRRRARPVREGYFLKSFGELREEDYVVHTDHGIGKYLGLKKLSIGKSENDFLLIEYLGGDKLYIPVDRLDQIQRYIGPDGYVPSIDKLGGSSWDVVKKRVKRSVREIAEELVSVYAAREVMEGHSFSPTDRYYDEFSSSFEYDETPDQAKAIDEIISDMSDSRPMDRLICGDAGFGKTEVALRASFRAAMEGKQVAVLVPTTILAEQHYQTFARRLEKTPVSVEVLNRFKTRAQQKEIVEAINRGLVDIVIGTHRILQKDVVFKDLGLVIIDEEQRFGVSHKEKLKKLRALIDVLTMTATPIPRTLHLSLIGIRDLSIINTPPDDRRSIKTYALEFDEDAIRDAIRREIERGGQVFFLHDRVRSIYTMARFVEGLVPEARVGVAHGQMKSRELENVMVKYLQRDYNVLVCTTIIGSGIDIPTANTMIINRADRFGLSQLYQLRGRVGRSKEEAYAFLLVPQGAMLSEDARKRLQVIKEFSEPGSGFRIASHDLEIRGAGNLLGISQSGHISAVGYELYTQLMERTVRELRGEKMPEEEIKPEINMGLPAFIPDDYIADMHRRLVTYKRVSMAATDDDLTQIREELEDCYGFIVPQVENLLEIISARNLLKDVWGEKMEYDGKKISIYFHKDSPVEPGKIVELSQKKMKGSQFTPDFKLSVPMSGLSGDEALKQAKSLLRDLTT
jgi:transcription-repair coupling factor (superfamily II helicase)